MAGDIVVEFLISIFSFFLFIIFIFPPVGMASLAILINFVIERIPQLLLQTVVLVALAILMAAIEPLVGREILTTLSDSLLMRTVTFCLMVGLVAVNLIPFAILRKRYTRKWQPAYVFFGTSIVLIVWFLQSAARLVAQSLSVTINQPSVQKTYIDFVVLNISHFPWIFLDAIVIYLIIAAVDTEIIKYKTHSLWKL